MLWKGGGVGGREGSNRKDRNHKKKLNFRLATCWTMLYSTLHYYSDCLRSTTSLYFKLMYTGTV